MGSIRRFLLSAGLVLGVVLAMGAVGVIPVRAFVEQGARARVATERLRLLSAENSKLASRSALLKTDAEIERIARRQFAMAKPGEDVYAVPGLRDEDPFGGDELVPVLPTPASPRTTGFFSDLWLTVQELMR